MPGDRLPTEHELSALSGLGRSTVREAIRTLESQRLVVTTRGVKGGTFVAQPDPMGVAESLSTQLDFLTGASRVTISELIEAREAIELPAVTLAAQRSAPDGMRLLDAIPARRGDESGALAHNWQFHAAVIKLARNALFELLAHPILGILETRFDRSGLGATYWETIDDEHRQIARLIHNADETGAREAMRSHLETVRRTYVGLDSGGGAKS